MRNRFVSKSFFTSLIFTALTMGSVQATEWKTKDTRYGQVSVGAEQQLLFNGRLVEPVIQGNSSLHIQERFVVGDNDVLLIQNIGGSACPALFHFLVVDKQGTSVTSEFGTCSDLYEIRQSGKSIIMKVPAEYDAINTYVFADGTLTENGRVIYPDPSPKAYYGQINDPDGYTNVREQPNGKSRIIGRMNEGERFTVYPDPKSQWWEVVVDGSLTGYIHRSRVKLVSGELK